VPPEPSQGSPPSTYVCLSFSSGRNGYPRNGAGEMPPTWGPPPTAPRVGGPPAGPLLAFRLSATYSEKNISVLPPPPPQAPRKWSSRPSGVHVNEATCLPPFNVRHLSKRFPILPTHLNSLPWAVIKLSPFWFCRGPPQGIRNITPFKRETPSNQSGCLVLLKNQFPAKSPNPQTQTPLAGWPRPPPDFATLGIESDYFSESAPEAP